MMVIWKSCGRLYNERDVSWMWIEYFQTRESARTACELTALNGEEGGLTWEVQTEEYDRATTANRPHFIYEVIRVEVHP